MEIRNVSSRVKKNISLVRCAHLRNIFQHSKRNFVSPQGHVISYISDHKKNENNSEHQHVTVMQAKQTLSAYHLYGKPGNSGENSNGMVHLDVSFPDKSNTFRGTTFLPK